MNPLKAMTEKVAGTETRRDSLFFPYSGRRNIFVFFAEVWVHCAGDIYRSWVCETPLRDSPVRTLRSVVQVF